MGVSPSSLTKQKTNSTKGSFWKIFADMLITKSLLHKTD